MKLIMKFVLIFLLSYSIKAQIICSGSSNPPIGYTVSFTLQSGGCGGSNYVIPDDEEGCSLQWQILGINGTPPNGAEPNYGSGTSHTCKFNNEGEYEIKVSKSGCDDSWNNDFLFASRIINVQNEVVVSSGDWTLCDGNWPPAEQGNGLSTISPNPEQFMSARTPALIAPSDPLCSSEVDMNSLGGALSMVVENMYEIHNHAENFTYTFEFCSSSNTEGDPNDFSVYYFDQEYDNSVVSIVDDTPETYNSAIVKVQGRYRGTATQTNYNYYTGEPTSTTIGTGWYSKCGNTFISSPCPYDNPLTVSTAFWDEIEAARIKGSNQVMLKSVIDRDLANNKEIFLEAYAVNSSNQSKFIYDWFVESSDGKINQVATDKSSIYASVEGNYFVKTRAKNVLNINEESVTLGGASEYHIASTDDITLYNSDTKDPTIIELICFPNPASDNVSVQYEFTGKVENAKLEIYNQSGNKEGELVKDFFVKEQANDIDLSWLNNGIYYIYLILNNGEVVQSTSLIKQ